jgi:hypothetical protein
MFKVGKERLLEAIMLKEQTALAGVFGQDQVNALQRF